MWLYLTFHFDVYYFHLINEICQDALHLVVVDVIFLQPRTVLTSKWKTSVQLPRMDTYTEILECSGERIHRELVSCHNDAPAKHASG